MAAKGSVTSAEGFDCGGYVKHHWDRDPSASSPVLPGPTAQHRLIFSLIAWDLLTSDEIFWYFIGEKIKR